MKKNQKIVIAIFTSGIILCSAVFLIGFFIANSNLKEFAINEIKKENDQYVLEFDSVRNATKYDIEITDEEGKEILKKEVTNNKVILDELNAKYDQKLQVKVTAYDSKDDSKEADNIVDFVWVEPSFSDENEHIVTTNKDFSIKVDGFQKNNDYTLKIYYENEVVFESPLDNGTINIPYSKIKSYAGRLTAYINKNNTTYDKFNFFINTVIVGNVNITTPTDDTVFDWENIFLKYEGGINATSIYLNVWNNGYLENKYDLKDGGIVLNAESLKENVHYTFEIRAVYQDYEEIAKSDSINVFVGEKAVVKPVITNYYHGNIKAGTKVSFSSTTKDAVIIYTDDGSNPVKYGKLYDGPITINENQTIKTYAVKPNAYDSPVSTYEFKIRTKEPVIYLSPSKQDYNPGARGSGYTTEYEMMNRLADVMQNVLKENGVKVYRNKPSGDILSWTAESRYVGSDLHFALHSNGSPNHDVNGMEIWVHEPTSQATSIATRLYENLYMLYPYKSNKANRGVKYAEGELGEVHPLNHKVATLIEVAFHDDYNDAVWITKNIEKIGENLSNTIMEFYQIK